MSFSLSLFCVQSLQFFCSCFTDSYIVLLCFTNSYIVLLCFTDSYIVLLCFSYSCFTDIDIDLLYFSCSCSVMLCLPSPRPSLFKALIKLKPSVNSYVDETHTLAKCAGLIRVQVHNFCCCFPLSWQRKCVSRVRILTLAKVCMVEVCCKAPVHSFEGASSSKQILFFLQAYFLVNSPYV